MIKSIKNKLVKNTLLVCLLSVFGAGTLLRAQDAPPAGRSATIVAVNKRTRTLTLRINGIIYRLTLSKHLVITKGRAKVPLQSLAAGEQISMVTGPTSDGGVEIVDVTILPVQPPAEAEQPPVVSPSN
jgi:hypothetical protein